MAKQNLGMNAELVTLADHVIQASDGKLSILGLFDTFNVTSIPFNWPRMFVVIVFKGVPETSHVGAIKITDPDKKTVYDQKGVLKTGDNGKVNLLVELNNFPLNKGGAYTVEVSVDGDPVDNFKFYVNKVRSGSNNEKKKTSKFQN